MRRLAGRVLTLPLLKLFLLFLLVAGIAAEAYYVVILRGEVARQDEDLRKMSVQLQTLKNRRNSLGEELSSIKKINGDKNNGNAPDRQD